ncbi:ribosome silencing factor [Sporanaerobium hydrogeniformans]|uniref:Ribosome silencing factor n=1 Tax=Sporanaerobium hydrogeniformans TaxID=3072179 RepID=A0AC61DF85_9FIRM|nr:ribosome silencing factor [Sporanaerobium hydrogeniformans]
MLDCAKKIFTIINKKSIQGIDVLDVHELTPLADIFIIATASNIRQTQAIANDVEDMLIEEGIRLRQKEGYQTAKWILMDYGNIIIHILHEEEAEFYGLNRLWKDAPKFTFE